MLFPWIVSKPKLRGMPLLPPFCSWSLVVNARWQTLSAELMLQETDTYLSQGCAVFRDHLIAGFGTSGFRAPGWGRGGCRIYGHTCSNTWHSCLLWLVDYGLKKRWPGTWDVVVVETQIRGQCWLLQSWTCIQDVFIWGVFVLFSPFPPTSPHAYFPFVTWL